MCKFEKLFAHILMNYFFIFIYSLHSLQMAKLQIGNHLPKRKDSKIEC